MTAPRLTLYDARGNRYLVVLGDPGGLVPGEAATAARTAREWGPAFLAAIRSATGDAPSDGVVIGRFGLASPIDLLIMNTDGSLAERSGNGLTIFARALADG